MTSEQMQENYDKVILVVVTILAVGVAGYLIFRSLSFSETFEAAPITPNNTLKDSGEAELTQAAANLTSPSTWDGNNLFVSIPVVETMEGDLPVLEEVGEGMIHYPVPNEWIQQYSPPYDITDMNVLSRDHDQDGFTLLEEFWVQNPDVTTDPTDPEDFPPLITKLCLIEMVSSDFQLIFQTQTDPRTFQINQVSESLGNAVHFEGLGARFAAKGDPSLNFTVVSYEAKSEVEPTTGGTRDVSELTISYQEPGGEGVETQALVRGVPWELPTYTGNFRNRMVGEEFELKRGQSFSLSNDPSKTFQVLEVTTQGATIVGPDGVQISVPRCQ